MNESARLAHCLDSLSRALVQLDHAAVDGCVSELADLRGQFGTESLSGADLGVLMFRVRHAADLAEAASAMYSGWMRMAVPAPAAYTAGGGEPVAAVLNGTLAMEA